MMCEDCDMLVETEYSEHREWTDRLEHYYGDESFRGDYEPQRVGETAPDRDDSVIAVRIDHCANCGAFVDGRTYITKKRGDEA